jgi:DNA-binding IclR family transcriptional regulator
VGFALLDVLGAAAGPLMLRDLAAAAGMSAAKAHRYLVSFQRLGLVLQDAATTRYDLGPAALQAWAWPRLSRIDAVQAGTRAPARADGALATRWRWRSGATTARPSCTGRSRPRLVR